MRRWLSAPWKERPWLVAALQILLAPIAFLWCFAAARKRRSATRAPTAVPTVCVGNLSLGGAGKSPVVREIAAGLLEREYEVGIVSRGYGKLPGAQMNDENLEHRWLLGEPARLRVLEDVDRVRGVAEFAHRSRSPTRQGQICLLDDGLQHYSCPRDLDLVVIDPGELRQAPLWPPPLGPYREGGPRALREALLRAPVRLWSRLPEGDDPLAFRRSVEQALARFGLAPELGRDFILHEKLAWHLAEAEVRPFAARPVTRGEAVQVAGAHGVAIALAGIAHPQRFFEGARRAGVLKATDRTVDLPDHGALPHGWQKKLADAELIVTTAKDAMRFGAEPAVVAYTRTRTLLIGHVGVAMESWDGAASALDELVLLRLAARVGEFRA